MTKHEFEALVEYNKKWDALLTKCSSCGCFTNPHYCGVVNHGRQCKTRSPLERVRLNFNHSFSTLRFEFEKFWFNGYSPAREGKFGPRRKYYVNSSQSKENWPLQVWKRNRIERFIKWY